MPVRSILGSSKTASVVQIDQPFQLDLGGRSVAQGEEEEISRGLCESFD